MRKYLAYDTETGGIIASETDLLELTLGIFDAQLQSLDSLSLLLKPDGRAYRLTAGAMKVNGIDIVEHDKKAITYSQAKPRLMEFLSRHSGGGKDKLTPVGHNINFDDSFIQEHLLKKPEWELHVDYHKLDTAVVGEFLRMCLIVPGSVPASLGKLADFFAVEKGAAHTSAGDVLTTMNLLKAMKQRVTRLD